MALAKARTAPQYITLGAPPGVLVKLLKIGAVYAILQVVTGIEVGVLAVGLYYAENMPLPAALSLAMPFGVPLFLAQAGFFAVALHCHQRDQDLRIQRRLKSTPPE